MNSARGPTQSLEEHNGSKESSEEINCKVRTDCRQTGADRIARNEAGQAKKRSQRKESDEPQTGHRHRAIRSSEERGKSAPKEDFLGKPDKRVNRNMLLTAGF